MNKMIFASIAVVAAALIGSPIRAEAGHRHHDHDGEVIAAIGGFVGGMIVGSILDDDPAPAVSVSYGHEHRGHRHGHWEVRKVRVWVPGRWAWVDRDCSRPRRVWIEGYYDVRRERVWVGHRDCRRCG